MDVIDSALHVFAPEEVCFSFNGGKDSTVVFHLLRAACLRRARADARVGEEAAHEAAASALLARVRMVYFEVEGNFPEVESFMEETCREFKLELLRLPPFKQGLERLIEEFGLRAVLIGTRATDPDGRGLEHFSPTTPGWPPMMRVSPALRWDYAAVWAFLRGCNLPFCSLYADGFTSLGVQATSRPNPSLARVGAGAGFKPAWELVDAELERAGRVPRHTATSGSGDAAAGPASGVAATTC